MGRWDKYICTTLQKRHLLPGPTPEQRDRLAAQGRRVSMEHIHWIDQDVIPGAYYGETTWIWPPDYPGQVTWEELAAVGYSTPDMFPHVHDFPELLSWWGTNPDDFSDTDPMAIQMDDEIIPLASSWVAYIPAGMPHMPVFPTGVRSHVYTRPTLHWVTGPGGVYTREKDEKTKEAEAHKQPPPAPHIVEPAEAKYARYLVFGTRDDVKRPDYMCPLDPRLCRPMAYIDQSVIPDAEFGCDTRWYLPGEGSEKDQLIMEPHSVPHGTSIACIALNYDDITDLCAEVELWIGGERHLMSKGFWAYVPPYVTQGPLVIRKVRKQVFFMMSWPLGEGVLKYPGGGPE